MRHAMFVSILAAAALQATTARPLRAAEAGTPAAETPKPANAGYENGFFVRDDSGANLLVFAFGIKALYTYSETNDVRSSAFAINEASLRLSGNVLAKAFGYGFEAEFSRGNVYLKDAFLDYAFIPGTLQLRAGQWKKPWLRSELTSNAKLELIDRPIVNKAMGAGRDIGVALHNGTKGSLEWALGAFNGTGERGAFSGTAAASGKVTGSFSNVPKKFHPMLVARAGYNHGGIDTSSEGDFEGGPLRFSLAANLLVDFDADADDKSSVRGGLDGVLKWEGFSLSGGLFASTSQNGGSFTKQRGDTLAGVVQTSYLVMQRVMPVLRYAVVLPRGDSNNVHELRAGLLVAFFKHKLKWQTDGSVLLESKAGGRRENWAVQSQLAAAF